MPTCAQGRRRRVDPAGSGECEGLGGVDRHSEHIVVTDQLAEADRLHVHDAGEATAAPLTRAGQVAAGFRVRQARRQVQHRAGAVESGRRGWCRSLG
ncbi:hypothetical protein GW17_00047072 [Ensete ventricosum]|nr:hypothetical protein GW17_00047072 [Ensete ventricosum]